MPRTTRVAALSAAVLLFCAAGGIAAPSIAQQANAVPAASYADHEGSRLSAESLGLGVPADQATPVDGFDAQAPVVTHAIAPSVPESILDRPQADDVARERDGRSLADLVADHETAEVPDEESDCLARAVYWESKGEPLAGQLAVANVVINRAQSGRFASTICGVVRQRGQFSFVRGGHIPAAPQGSRDWRTAVAIARIARHDLADGAAPRALFFHARSVHPGWRLTRVASVGNHIFYR
jgi:N-acetylmuramoyl-L-alanine amidase